MKLKAKKLTEEAFAPYGTFVRASECFDGSAPMAYLPDKLNISLRGSDANIGVCRIAPQAAVMDVMESHSATQEGWFIMTGDGVAAFGSACEDANKADYEAFEIPAGTAISLKAGVWHFAPFPVGNEVMYVYAVLPPNTPARDMQLCQLEERIEITY